MTTQLFSFFYFGIYFFLVLFFYKHNDRKLILLAIGLLCLMPLSFGSFELSIDEVIYVPALCVLLMIVFFKYKGRYRYFFLMLLGYFVISAFTIIHISIIESPTKPLKRILLTDDKIFQCKNGKKISLDKDLLINNLADTLYVKKTDYGQNPYDSTLSNSVLVEIILPYSKLNHDYSISYYFEEPPSTITISRKTTEDKPKKTTLYWLQK